MAWSTSLLLLVAFLSVFVDGGVMVPDADTKIVGGQDIEISEMPWQVFLKVGIFTCGGSIISPQWIITAAHCTVGRQSANMWMLVGTNSIEKKEPKYYVEEVINHENYSRHPLGAFNDISLIKSKTVLNLDGRPLRAVTLPGLGAERPPVDTPVRVSGWGLMEDKKFPTTLKAANVTILDYKECQEYGRNVLKLDFDRKFPSVGKAIFDPDQDWEENNWPGLDESTQICANLPGKGSCKGDSGGPLVNGDVLLGIVSYGDIQTFCGGRPGVYTDVTVFRGWIKEHSGV